MDVEDCLDEPEFDIDFRDVENECISAIVTSFKAAEFTIVENVVKIDDPELLAQGIWNAIEIVLKDNIVPEILNKAHLSNLALTAIADFVNHNYAWRDIK